MSSEAAKPAGLGRATAMIAAHPAIAAAAIAVLTLSLIAYVAYSRGLFAKKKPTTAVTAAAGPSAGPADVETEHLIASINGS